MNPILAIDVGNTNISFGVLKKLNVIKQYSLDVNLTKRPLVLELKKILNQIARQYDSPDEVLLCSVVPSITKFVQSAVKQCLSKKAIVIGKDIEVPLKNKYRDPKQVGQDRLLGAYAVSCLYGSPAIVIDLGTAITFDVLSHKNEYEGGIILPGIRLSAESLFKKTALLPHIEAINSPRRLIGKDTQESILSGLFYGYGAMCRGLIDDISEEIRQKSKVTPKVIMTGGYARLMKKFILAKIHAIDPDLVFKGVGLLKENKGHS